MRRRRRRRREVSNEQRIRAFLLVVISAMHLSI